MRYRVTDYTIDRQTIVLPDEVTIEDIRLVVNETQKKVICSSMQKNNVHVEGVTIDIPSSVCIMQSGDQLTIEIDKGDNLADIKLPEIDTSILAKQGDDQEATNTEILKEIRKIPDLKNIYSVRFEKNDDNINTYTMVLPLVAGIEGDTIIL